MTVAPATAAPTACLLIIGNEILSGRTQDVNLNHLAKVLGGMGVRLKEARVVADDEAAIVEAVNQTRARYTYVFTTGGIGPTHDDITAACVAKAFGVPLLRDPEAVRRLEAHYAASGRELNEARLRMANVPEGGILIDNPVSAAPGFQVGNVFVMAGVPSIMQAMLAGLTNRLVGGPVVLARTVRCLVGEGDLAAGLGAIQDRYPDVDIGSYPTYREGRFATSLVLRSPDAVRLSAATDEVAALVRGKGAEAEVVEGAA
ncbi:competence/damage-inducible protein A [Nitrospirillum iridis]|uniref:Molybdenum cofactor synthesis domain-containing protein n=1 Tax=Nitrospirillum iridis TaxID=765888 RepID=A0A7X0EE38_9PROT|nr:molybdopterin-binding protein [Nitrospirillum iridis]MBB6253453.1 molybdenum cofactor synthesis domain-containing protein [Nitrospirillum iridis]